MQHLDALDCDFKLAETRGEAAYVADLPHKGIWTARFYRASIPRGRILKIHLPSLPADYHVFGPEDIPGHNSLKIVGLDWPVLADGEVRYLGQEMLLFVGPDPDLLDRLIEATKVDFEPLPIVADIDEAAQLKGGAIHGDDNRFGAIEVARGDVDQAFNDAPRVIEECCETGYQEHSYIETQGMCGRIDSQQRLCVEGSMQCPMDVHHAVAHMLGLEQSKIRVVQCPTGGGFGGKEDYPYLLACAVALAVHRLKRPVRMIYDRVEDMLCSTKRHPSRIRFRSALNERGELVATDILIELNCGAYESLSNIVLQRAVTSITGSYRIPNQRIRGIGWATNAVPSGAFRGFGAPQVCFAIENHMQHLAGVLGEEPVHFKQRHFIAQGDPLVTGAPLHDKLVLDELIEQVTRQSDYYQKRERYGRGTGRGIALSLVFHGCGMAGDCEQNLVGAIARLEKDGEDRVSIRVSNVDIGQGLSLTFRKIVAGALDCPLSQVLFHNPDTSLIPDSGPTVASRSIQVVGYILEKAARRLKESWQAGQVQQVEEQFRQPDYHQWDQQSFQGNPYLTNSWAANVVEVEVDPLTAEVSVTGIWGSYDIGRPIDRRVFEGQIDGGWPRPWAMPTTRNLSAARDALHNTPWPIM
ncbi:xanthine dehydrogenase family protein molybdopterin-binding subunit [Dongshaea marina]|uniref:xanthine dehydrogenase family protein molybdopterin-binding subunit n=1 Tax=Dongshaea marina TaxID=2047966 RepID=UPI00131F3CBF|nr:xanthine dehydrogenase family protein molybdopterin-binding subunit [Dongshaea marina]